MNVTGMLHGARLLAHVDFPTSEVLGPGASEDQIQDLIDRHELIFIKPLFKGGVGKKGKAGLLGKASDLQDGAGREGAPLFRRAPPRQRHGQGQRRHLRGRRAGRARGLFRDQRLDPLPRADHDAHPHGRRRHRGARQGPGRAGAVRGADRAQGLRRRQRADRHRRAEGDHLAAGPASAEAVGAGPPLRHDHAGAQPDPHAARAARAA